MARPKKVSDEQILAAARQCFLEHGPSVSTTVIAEQLGVSQAALFKRFNTKEELMVASLVPTEREPWMDRLSKGPEPGDIFQQLLEIAADQLFFFQRLIPAIMLLRSTDIDHKAVFAKFDVSPPLRGHMILSAWFQRAMDSGQIRKTDPDILAYIVAGALQIRPFLSHVSGGKMKKNEILVYVKSILEILWPGMAPEQDPS